MANMPRYPSLFQINTRVWLQRLSRGARRRVTLADIDDATLDGFAERGFDWIWLLSVWQIGAAGRAVSRGNPQWRAEFQAILPDLTEDDICGSGFAITAYTVSDAPGRWRRRWRSSAKNWRGATSSCCSISCRTVPLPTTPG